MAKVRPLNEIMHDLEAVLEELTDPQGHDAQFYEVISLVHGWLVVHAPHARETYSSDDSHPVLYYGPKEGLK